jgi:hypothetical protein
VRLLTGLLLLAGFAAQGSATSFDGTWDTVLSCPDFEGALGFSYRFDSVVKNGELHGEQGAKGKSGFYELNGTIGPDGAVHLLANGLVNNPRYAIGGINSGTPFAYKAEAKFSGDRGAGKRTQGRPCDLTFMRR